MILGDFKERYLCPKCATRVSRFDVQFGRPCPMCGFLGRGWVWEISRKVWRWWPPRVEWEVAKRD